MNAMRAVTRPDGTTTIVVWVLTAHWNGEETTALVGVFTSESIARAYVTKRGSRDYITMHRECVDEPFVFGDEEPIEVWRKK